MSLQKFLAAPLSMLLVACSATRQVPPASGSPAGLVHYVLVIKEHPTGQVTHEWQPAENFELSAYRRSTSANGRAGRFAAAAAWTRDCDQENQECYRKCMERPLPRGYESFTSPRKRGGKSEFCRGECQQAYDDCVELERLHPQEFTETGGAIDWLKRHRKEVLLGSVIIIAGVAFVVVSAGAGLLVLAPVALMASQENQPLAPVAEGPR